MHIIKVYCFHSCIYYHSFHGSLIHNTRLPYGYARSLYLVLYENTRELHTLMLVMHLQLFFSPSPKPYHWRVGVIWIGCHIPLSCIKFSLYSFVFFVVLVLPLMFTQFLPFSFAQLTSAILFYASLYVNLINFPLYVTHINVNVFLMYTLCSTG